MSVKDQFGQAPDAVAASCRIELTLVVDGASLRSARAIAHAHRLCAEHLPEGHALTIVDIRHEPPGTLRDGMLMAPMLVRRLPLPVRRVVGDLSRTDRVLDALGLR